MAKIAPSQPSPEPSDEQYRAYLVFLAQTLTPQRFRSKLDIEGVVQHTLLEAWQKPVDGDRLQWLKRALACNLNDELRKLYTKKRGGSVEQSLEDSLNASSQRLCDLIESGESRPSQRFRSQEREVEIAKAMQRLPKRQRDAIELYYWHDLSLAAAGNALDGLSAAAVAGLVRRGLSALRKMLNSDEVS
jgi:RNA polymerase sigma factor (sigma-70 family)